MGRVSLWKGEGVALEGGGCRFGRADCHSDDARSRRCCAITPSLRRNNGTASCACVRVRWHGAGISFANGTAACACVRVRWAWCGYHYSFLQSGSFAQREEECAAARGLLAAGAAKGGVSVMAVWMASQLARGMEYLHSAKVMHRDLKPENVLLGANHSVRVAFL